MIAIINIFISSISWERNKDPKVVVDLYARIFSREKIEKKTSMCQVEKWDKINRKKDQGQHHWKHNMIGIILNE